VRFSTVAASPALSQFGASDSGDTIASRKIAVLAADGADVVGAQRFKEQIEQRGAVVEVLAPVAGGTLRGGSGRRTSRRPGVHHDGVGALRRGGGGVRTGFGVDACP
jgi:hypothetical protein